MPDLHHLQEKFPNHLLSLRDREFYCDGERLLHIPADAALERLNIKIDGIIEMMIRLKDDPHWYDYERVQERLKSEFERSNTTSTNT